MQSKQREFPNHKSSKFFQDIQEKLNGSGKEMAKKINATIGFEVTGEDQQKFIYTLDTKNGNSSLLYNDSCK